jgi:putative transposase
VIFRFIQREKANYSVVTLCRVLGVSRSGYYAWEGRAKSAHAQRDEELLGKIRDIFERSGGRYGSPRVHAELKLGHGERVARKRVARLMRTAGLVARGGARRAHRPAQRAAAPFADELGRDFRAEAPDRVWVADITQHDTLEGWLYLSVVLDVFARRVVGWSMGERATTELVIDALSLAVARRQPRLPVVHHSDRGTQYTSLRFTKHLQNQGLVGSMGRSGSPGDNALMESFFATVQVELLDLKTWRTRDELRSALFEYLEITYNRQRRHSSLGYLTPKTFEDQARAKLPPVQGAG